MINLCPACRRVNAKEAQSCAACGNDLGESEMQRSPQKPPGKAHSAGALWLDDLGLFFPPSAAEQPDATSFSITVREVDSEPAPRVVVDSPAIEPVAVDPEVQLPVGHATVGGAVDTPLRAEDALYATQRAARRSEVRRDRRHAVPATKVALPNGSDILVLGADGPALDQLCGLLRDFGFVVLQASDPTKALIRSASSPFVAIFVAVALETTDSGDRIELCRQVRNVYPRRGAHATVLVLVADRLRPVDRVRADLAGCDEVILSPVARGSVARLLDARGIALPSDARGT